VKTRESGPDRRHRRDVDDHAALLLVDERLPEDLAAEDDGLVVRVEDALHLLVADVEEGRGRVRAGAVERDRQLAELLHGLGRDALDLGLLRDVGRDEDRLAAGVLDGGQPPLGLRGVAPDDRDLGARLGERLGHRAAQLARAAGDDGDFALQRKLLLEETT
jgi:hypothetical protein